MKLLIANRGEIAIRVARAAADLGIPTVAIYAQDDSECLHVRRADNCVALPGSGVRAYLDMDAIIAAARSTGCTAVHPGYGFLSENSAFATRCADEGLLFVGPSPEVLELLGNKATARMRATELGLPVLPGTNSATDLDSAVAFFDSSAQGGMVIKALAGGGGRGMRIVTNRDEIPQLYARCQSEAKAAFGDDRLYVEKLVERARHIEVQVLGDRAGAVMHLWERDCTLQRRNQKLIEMAPSPSLGSDLRERLLEAAVRYASAIGYQGLGTFEFLVDLDDAEPEAIHFIEANPRLHVEHTVTEEITGVDLVQAQLRIARGDLLGDLGLAPASPPSARGFAIQLRVNMETMGSDGTPRPSSGTLAASKDPRARGFDLRRSALRDTSPARNSTRFSRRSSYIPLRRGSATRFDARSEP